MTNCLLYAVALYWRRRRKGKRVYLAMRKSDLVRLPHFVVFELRRGVYRVVSYKPSKPNVKEFPVVVFEGDPRWGDEGQPPPLHPPKE